ncbi:MAG: 16S rRNA (cytosine(1402)-N(4))-methyltransferase RsmH [Microgenomates group bacterium]
MHKPVLLPEVIKNLGEINNGLFIDATFGEGGHSIEILKRKGKVLGIEWDEKQYKKAKTKFESYIKSGTLKLINDNFCRIKDIAKKNNFFPVNGILFDLGLSMNQLASSGRGFSHKQLDDPLDMRLNLSLKVKAADLINSLNKDQLYEILAKYSEEVDSLRLVEAIISSRKIRRIEKVKDLIEIINKVTGAKEKVYARVFQALRIAVNDELENLKKALEATLSILKPEGRILIISFHSVEDRVIKNFIKEKSLKLLNKKAIKSKTGNKFERSALLRVITQVSNF